MEWNGFRYKWAAPVEIRKIVYSHHAMRGPMLEKKGWG